MLNLLVNRKIFTFLANTLLLFMSGFFVYLIEDKSFFAFSPSVMTANFKA